MELGDSVTITADVTQAAAGDGYLQGWIDWNSDGDFADSGEQIATNLQLTGATTGTISIPVTVPLTASTSQTFARFRWSATASLNSTDYAVGGEVEDYALTITSPPSPAVCSPVFNTEVARNLYFFEFNGVTVSTTPTVQNYALPDGRNISLTLTRTSGVNVEGHALQNFYPLYGLVNGGENFDSIVQPTLWSTANTQAATFRVQFSQALDIFSADGEISQFDESISVQTNGGVWEQIDGTTPSGYTLLGAETSTWQLVANSSGTTGTPVMFSRGATQIDVSIAASAVGRSGVVFGVHMPDVGDAPASYGVAAHRVNNVNPACTAYGTDSTYLGALSPDGEHPDAVQSTGADGDQNAGLKNDEDGVSLPALIQGQAATIPVIVNQAAANSSYLQAWFDWNGDGDFTDTDEQVATNVQYAAGTSGTINLPVTVPISAVASTIARFRWSTNAGLSHASYTANGEAEYYPVTITALNAELTGAKTVAMLNSGDYSIPGNDVVYTITANNVGNGAITDSSIFLVDNVPTEVDFFNGDHDGTGPSTDIIGFNAATSGLTGLTVGYSDAGTAPADMTECNYTPTPPNDIDNNVTYICFNPSGVMAAGDPDPNFSISFRARIK